MDLATILERDMAESSSTLSAPPSKAPWLADGSHVTWQSSQRCEVLSRVEVSAQKRFNSGTTSSQGSISGFSSPQSDNGDTVCSPKASRRPISRVHTFEDTEPYRNVASTANHTSSIPLFDKQNPAGFFALLKGVSARVDENAGVRNVTRPTGLTDMVPNLKRKRPQISSVGHSPVSKKIMPKFSGTKSTGERLEDAFPKPQNLRGYQSLPNIVSNGGISQRTKEPRDRQNIEPQISPTSSYRSTDQESDFNHSRSYSTNLHPLLQKASSNAVTGGPHQSDSLSSEPSTSSSLTAGAANKYSMRPPVLGMRRTRTLSPGVQSQKRSDKTTKLKGFRPPLLHNPSQHPENPKTKLHVPCPTKHGMFSQHQDGKVSMPVMFDTGEAGSSTGICGIGAVYD